MTENASKTIAWNCPNCERPTEIQILEAWDMIPSFDDAFDPFQWLVGRCKSCSGAMLFTKEAPWYGDEDESALFQVYPEKARTLPASVPFRIRETFDEANRCMSVKAYTAVVLLARKAVENLCKELNAVGDTLAAKLKNLKDVGILDEKLFNWSSLIREVGNSGAHESKAQISRENAQDVIEFVEALIDYHYVFQAKYQEFVERNKITK